MTEAAKTNAFVIPYRPRKHFLPLHNSKKRFRFVVAHRRAGKSVAEVNEIIRRAFENPRQYPPPRYAYIGPSFAQAKDLIWNYLKFYLAPFGDQVKFSESELQVTLPTGAMINLYGGSAAYERMRGLYFDGAVADEYAMLDPDMWESVIRPCLSDYKGWFIASGTSNGDDHFHALKIKAEANDKMWDVFVIPVNETDALDPDELADMIRDMSPDRYAREMLCSFAAPIEGAYYGDQLNDMEMQGRITKVPFQPEAQCWTEWDLGIDDDLHINIKQQVGKEIHQIDEIVLNGVGLEVAARELVAGHRAKYKYKAHLLPHDVAARELGTGKTRKEVLESLMPNDQVIYVVPAQRIEDGIQAVRVLLPVTWIDKEKCPRTINSLRNYSVNKKTGKPMHNWASHAADATRTGATGMHMVMSWGSNVTSMLNGKLRRRIRGRV